MLEYISREKLQKLVVKHQNDINLSTAYPNLKQLTKCMAVIFTTHDINQLKRYGQLLKQAVDVNTETKSFDQSCEEASDIDKPIIKALYNIHRLSQMKDICEVVREHVHWYTWMTDMKPQYMKAVCDGFKLKRLLAHQQKNERKKFKRLAKNTSTFFHKHHQHPKHDKLISPEYKPNSIAEHKDTG